MDADCKQGYSSEVAIDVPANGPPDAPDFRVLFDSVLPDLHGFIARQAPPAEVDEIAAEIMGAVYARWDKAPSALEDQRKWVFGFAVNMLKEFHRKQLKHTSLFTRLNWEQREFYSFDEVITGIDRVRHLLGLLSDKERDVVLLTVFSGFTCAETAQILGVTTSTVTTRVARARKHLQAFIKAEELHHEKR